MAANVSNEITDRTQNTGKEVGNIPMQDDGKWKYPLVGASAGSTFYLDTTSCTYWVSKNVANVSCIVYEGGGGQLGMAVLLEFLQRIFNLIPINLKPEGRFFEKR